MKKFYFLAATAIVMASCTNEESIFEPKAPKEIAFQAVATNATRGAVTSASNWTAPIYVSAAYSASDVATYTNLFDNHELVKFVNSGASWVTPTDGTQYYYPSDGTIDFLAYASGTPTVGEVVGDEVTPTATVTRDEATGEFTNLELDYTANSLAGKTDVMYALTPHFGCPPTSTAALGFKHALAWLSIEVLTGGKANQVYIKSIHVNNVYLTGKLSVPISNHTLGEPSWNVDGVTPSEAVPFPAYCPSNPTLVGQLSAKEGVLVVPGEQTQLTLVYQLAQNLGTDITHTFNLNPNKKEDGSDALTWDAGKHYTYKISFDNLQIISFVCSVDSYEPGTVCAETIKP